jgi:hypothetical protein
MAEDRKETTLTVKWGIVLALFGTIIVYLLTTMINHEHRIAVVETNNMAILSIVTEIKTDLKEHLKTQTTPCQQGKK